jgi:hypothetical protein
MNKRLTLLSLAAVVAGFLQAADIVKVTVRNPLGTARSGEMVEISTADLARRLGSSGPYIVRDADGRETASQSTHDGLLIFQVGVAAKGSSSYTIEAGQPASYEPRVFGRQFPERADDIAWENDLVAFRCYGPALQRNNERAFGYDIWNKRTDRLVVEQRYAGELDKDMAAAMRKLRQRGENDLADDVYNAISYHVDHGNGMDCYKVGPTLGAGTNALLADGGKTIVYPYCYQSFEILDRGPLRFTVRLTYETKAFAGQPTTEERIVSLDAGSQMNKAVVVYRGLTAKTPVGVGIVVHNENPTAYVFGANGRYMGYEDLGDPNQYKEKYRARQNQDFGKIYVGAVFPSRAEKVGVWPLENVGGSAAHLIAQQTLAPGAQLTYYFGSGWSRNPATRFQSLTDWESYLSAFAERLAAPLKVSLK